MRTEQRKRGPSELKIGVRQETRDKFKRIAQAKRWTLVETADALADKFIEVENIPPADTRRRRQSAA